MSNCVQYKLPICPVDETHLLLSPIQHTHGIDVERVLRQSLLSDRSLTDGHSDVHRLETQDESSDKLNTMLEAFQKLNTYLRRCFRKDAVLFLAGFLRPRRTRCRWLFCFLFDLYPFSIRTISLLLPVLGAGGHRELLGKDRFGSDGRLYGGVLQEKRPCGKQSRDTAIAQLWTILQFCSILSKKNNNYILT